MSQDRPEDELATLRKRVEALEEANWALRLACKAAREEALFDKKIIAELHDKIESLETLLDRKLAARTSPEEAARMIHRFLVDRDLVSFSWPVASSEWRAALERLARNLLDE